jgi:hypothetical protein
MRATAIIAIILGLALCLWLAMSVRVVILPMEKIDTRPATIYVVIYRPNVAAAPTISALCLDKEKCERLAGGFEVVIGGRYECKQLTI